MIMIIIINIIIIMSPSVRLQRTWWMVCYDQIDIQYLVLAAFAVVGILSWNQVRLISLLSTEFARDLVEENRPSLQSSFASLSESATIFVALVSSVLMARKK